MGCRNINRLAEKGLTARAGHMIITRDFVMLLFPKTGTNFMRAALKYLYTQHEVRYSYCMDINLLNPPVEGKQRYSQTQHGGYVQIPKDAGHLTDIYSALRNIYSLLVSEYAYMRWQVDWLDREEAVRAFPDFPIIPFAQFLHFSNHVIRLRLRRIHNNPNPPAHLGMQSYRFLLMFCRDPWTVLGKIDDAYIESGAWLNDLCPVKFLQQHRLREDMETLLGQYDFKPGAVKIMRHIPPAWVNRSIVFDPALREWRIRLIDILEVQNKIDEEQESLPPEKRAFRRYRTLHHREDVVQYGVTIAPDPDLMEQVRRTEPILFRFAEAERPEFYATGEWDAKAMTDWPEGESTRI